MSFAVDTHAHIFEHTLPMIEARRHDPKYDALAETYLDILKVHKLDMGLLVQPSFLGTDNSYILAALKKYPAKFRGVAVVPADISENDFILLHKAGYTGFRLNLINLPLPDLASAVWTPLLRMARQHEWHVEIHRESRDLPYLVRPLLEAGVKVVIDHFGRMDPTLLPNDPVFPWLLSLGPSRRVWVKISASYRMGSIANGEIYARLMLPRLLESFGQDRLLWGSDWPNVGYEDKVSYPLLHENFTAWVPDASVRDVILRCAPAALFAPV